MDKSNIVLFIFRRDLRLEDNLPLQEALNFAKEHSSEGLKLLPIFIFTPQQVGKDAPVKSAASVSCLLQSLEELDDTLRSRYKSGLCILYDENIKALTKLKKNSKYNISAIFQTKDYTPFAKYREVDETKFCEENGIEYHSIDYLYMHPPGSILNGSGKPYQKFTPFYNATEKLKVPKPQGWVEGEFLTRSEAAKLTGMSIETLVSKDKNQILTKAEWKSVEGRQQIGGRKEGLMLLKEIPKDYDKIRDQFAAKTSHLSVHLHYGTVSIREVWYTAKNVEFKRQLVWRDFYGQLMDNFDDFYKSKYDGYSNFHDWLLSRPKLSKQQQKDFDNWCNGTTGIEIIDASMTQMNQTHYMINRGRLIVANYLIKTMKVPWQYGAGYFAEKLLDYDYVNNSMNWLFIAGGFPFSEPPFRVYNPQSFEKKFDKDKEYIKTWLK